MAFALAEMKVIYFKLETNKLKQFYNAFNTTQLTTTAVSCKNAQLGQLTKLFSLDDKNLGHYVCII